MTKELKSERNLGIDIFRIFSMLMIVTLHVLGHGGLLYSGMPERENILYVPEAFALSAVNCYALVSGYLGNRGKYTVRKFMKRWGQVFFYSLLFLLLALIFYPEDVDRTGIIHALFPTICAEYWYFTAYVAVFALAPFINKALVDTTKKQALVILSVLFVFTSFLPAVFAVDTFALLKGYSALWLVIMYVYGFLISKHRLFEGVKTWVLVPVVVLSTFLSWGSRLVLPDGYWDVLLVYTAPTQVVSAVALLLLFAKIRIEKGRFRSLLVSVSSLTFGVYLIHDNPFVRHIVIGGRFAYLLEENVSHMLLMLTVYVLTVFSVCVFIEYLRTLLFRFGAFVFVKIKERVKKNG